MFKGKHYETGTIADALAAIGKPTEEATVLGASGGIAFGHFVFAYKGQLPHVALLTRNTFSPFERALDNLGIRREVRTTTDPEKGERNLREALELGYATIVWADAYSLPHLALPQTGMWMMRPLLIVGQEHDGFVAVDGQKGKIQLPSEVLRKAREKVKKDRNRMMTIEDVDEIRQREGLREGIRTAIALMLDKPPAGSVDNFGISGMSAWAKALASDKGPKSWTKSFATGPEIVQALAGQVGQPVVWYWIETWCTAPGADRGTYADFLMAYDPSLVEIADGLRRSAELWRRLAAAALPDDVPELRNIRLGKEELALAKGDRRAALRTELAELTKQAASSERVAAAATEIKQGMATVIDEIKAFEEEAFRALDQKFRSA